MELMDYIEQVKAERAERRAEKREELLEKLESGQKEIALSLIHISFKAPCTVQLNMAVPP